VNRISQNISAVLLYSAIVSLVFFGVLSGQKVFFAGDIQQHYIPWESFVDKQIEKGDFPLWNPSIFGGHPIHAEGQSAILYPITRIVYLIFDGAHAFSIDMLIHLILGGFFVYLLGRRINLGYYPSLYSGAVFTLAGYPVCLIINAPILRSVAWIPLITLLALSIWHGGRLRSAILLALAIALQILAGSMQVVAMTAVMLIFLSVFFIIGMILRRKVSLSGLVWIFLIAFPLSFLLTSAQFIPSYFLLQKSFINNRITSSAESSSQESEKLQYSFSPYHLLDIVTPPYWAQNPSVLAKDPEIPFQMTLFLYIGTIPFLMALIGFVMSKGANIWRGLIIAGILAGLGGYTFFQPLMMKLIPFTGFFRAPDRYMFMYAIAVSVLAGYGFRKFLGKELPENPDFKSKWYVPSFILFLLLLTGGILIDIYIPGLIERTYDGLKNNLTGEINNPVKYSNFLLIIEAAKLQILLSILLICILGFTWASLRSNKYKTILAGSLIFLLSICETGYYLKTNPGTRLIPSDYFTSPPESVEYINAADAQGTKTSTAPYRIQSLGALSYGEKVFGYPNMMLWYHGGGKQADYYRFREILNPNLGNVFDKYYISGISSLYTSSWSNFTILLEMQEEIFLQRPDYYASRVHLWDLSGIRYIISDTPLPEGRLTLLNAGDVYVYENNRVLPRALILYPVKVYSESDQVVNEMVMGRLKIEENLILATGRESTYQRGDLPESRTYSPVIISSYNPEKVVISGFAESHGYLLLNDTFDKGWQCRINGEIKPVYRAYTYFRAVPVEAGRFEAIFEYKPVELKYGILLSIAGIVIWLSLYFITLSNPDISKREYIKKQKRRRS
jgi:hypothetical protein